MIQIDQELFYDLCSFLDSHPVLSTPELRIQFQNAQSLKSRLKDCQIQQINEQESKQVGKLEKQIELLNELNLRIDKIINKENKINKFEGGEKQNEND